MGLKEWINGHILKGKGVGVESEIETRGKSKRKCEFIKEDGSRCKAYALKDSQFCLAHDNRAHIVKIREDASKLAGLSQKILFPEVVDGKLPPIKPINVKRSRDIKKAIVRTLQEVRYGRIDIDVGRTLLYGFNVLINCIDKIQIIEKLEELEQIVKERAWKNVS